MSDFVWAWYACAACDKVDKYIVVDDNGKKRTSFDRDHLERHTFDIIAGLESEEKAQEWLDIMRSNRAGKAQLKKDLEETGDE